MSPLCHARSRTAEAALAILWLSARSAYPNQPLETQNPAQTSAEGRDKIDGKVEGEGENVVEIAVLSGAGRTNNSLKRTAYLLHRPFVCFRSSGRANPCLRTD